ncbi:hypothetical protein [Kushneria aurantia]|uniref:Uncharacterized protein n=1 Tax=Kushneria aurantia TaxID=504092 RepID=A0ABV6G4Y5_9GAMM|nr:hypothetical protein [Kushneria aurantia]
MKPLIWIVLAGLSIAPTSWASPTPPRLPAEMVMVAPPLESVGAGLEIQRLVHGQFEQEGGRILALLHLIRRPLGEPPTCRPGADGCLPNVSDSLTLRLNTHDRESPATTLPRVRGEPITDSSSTRTPIFRDMFQLLAVGALDIQHRGNTWTMTDESGVTTTWKPMSLEQASNASYFVQTLTPPAYAIEQCVAAQLSDAYATQSPTAAQSELLDAVSIISAPERLRDSDDSSRYEQAALVKFAAQLLAGSDDVPDTPADFVSTPPYAAMARDAESRALLMNNAERISSASRYLRRLDRLSHSDTPDAQERIICGDLVTLDSP